MIDKKYLIFFNSKFVILHNIIADIIVVLDINEKLWKAKKTNKPNSDMI